MVIIKRTKLINFIFTMDEVQLNSEELRFNSLTKDNTLLWIFEHDDNQIAVAILSLQNSEAILHRY